MWGTGTGTRKEKCLDCTTQTASKQGKGLAKMDTNILLMHQNGQMHTHFISVNIQLHQGSIIISKIASHLLLACYSGPSRFLFKSQIGLCLTVHIEAVVIQLIKSSGYIPM